MEKLATYIVREGPLTAHDAVGWVARLAGTLEPIHGLGVSHGRVSAKAIQIEDPACTTDGFLLDTADLTDDPAYYSMDRTEGAPRSPESDVWAVGVTLYQLLTGTLPFPGTTARAVKRRLLGPPPAPLAVFDVGDDKLQRILDRLFERNPAQRLSTIGELREYLEDFDPLVATLPPLSYGKPGESDEDDGWEDDDSADEEELTAVRELPAELLQAVGEIKRREASVASGAPPAPPVPQAPPAAPAPADAPSSPGLEDALPAAPDVEPSEDIDVLHDVLDEETQLEQDILPSFDEEPNGEAAADDDGDRISQELFGDAVVTAADDVPSRPGDAPGGASPPRRPPPPPKPAAKAKPPAEPMFPPADAAPPAPKPAEPEDEPVAPEPVATRDEPAAPKPAAPKAKAEQSKPTAPKAQAAKPKPAAPKAPPPDPKAAAAVPTPADSKPRAPLPSSSADALLVSTTAAKPKRSRKLLMLALLVVAGAGGALFVIHDPLGLGLGGKLRQWWSSVTGAPAPTATTPTTTATSSAPASTAAPTASTAAVVAASTAPSASAPPATSSAASAASSEPPAASASASASGSSAPPDPPKDLRACVETFFPEDTFVGRNPKLGFLCEQSNPLKGAVEVRTQVVLCGGGMKGVTDGMHEWSTIGWYGMAAFVVIRSHCCESPTPIQAPKTVAKCDFDEVLAKLGEAVHGSDDEAAEQAVKDYTKAINCLARGGAARLFDQSGFPKGGELTTFKKVFARAREQAKR